jgi:hypothetical protein
VSQHLGKLVLDLNYLIAQRLQIVSRLTYYERAAALTGNKQALLDEESHCPANGEVADTQLIGKVVGARDLVPVFPAVDPGAQYIGNLDVQVARIGDSVDGHRRKHTSYRTVWSKWLNTNRDECSAGDVEATC